MSNSIDPANGLMGNMEDHFFRASASDFKKIPDSPIAYWVSLDMLAAFERGDFIDSRCSTRKGMATGKNAEFVRNWAEVSVRNIGFGFSRSEAKESLFKWFPYANGGDYRKWYGDYEDVVNWEGDGGRLQNELHESGLRIRAVNLNLEFIFKEGLSWTSITSASFSIRWLPRGFLFSSASNAIFSNDDLAFYLGLLNSKVHAFLGKVLNPTLNANPGDIGRIPLPERKVSSTHVPPIIKLSQEDWDSYEPSWDFTQLSLLAHDRCGGRLSDSYLGLRKRWCQMTQEMRRLEEENNRIFIEAYGLQDELTPDVPLKEITLTCNPHYRYGGDKTDEELEALLLADTMREFLSYAVGCMFGRYSLDKPGLVLANQGETLADYLRQVPEPSFMPDEDNVIPLLDGEWFPDDVTERFRQFLRVTFGAEHYAENLAFIEGALGKDVRKYFLKDFYADHVKRYKKRPIYWLFASPKGTFSALIYLHRYRPDTVSVVLQYLRDFRKKLAARLEHLQQVQVSTSASQGEKTRAGKEADTIRKQQLELDDYERDTLYPLATEQVPLDLDDGVKVNYLKLGAALKTIPGLAAKGVGPVLRHQRRGHHRDRHRDGAGDPAQALCASQRSGAGSLGHQGKGTAQGHRPHQRVVERQGGRLRGGVRQPWRQESADRLRHGEGASEVAGRWRVVYRRSRVRVHRRQGGLALDTGLAEADPDFPFRHGRIPAGAQAIQYRRMDRPADPEHRLQPADVRQAQQAAAADPADPVL
jgi:hypothetical protein